MVGFFENKNLKQQLQIPRHSRGISKIGKRGFPIGISKSIIMVVFFLASASAVFDYDTNCPGTSWWLRMEEASGGAGSTLQDACAGNDFYRVGFNNQEPAVWDYGQTFGGFDDWAVMDNESTLTTGSRSWRAIVNLTTTYGTSLYSDNQTASVNWTRDWSNFMLWEGDGALWCYCRQSDDGLRYVYAFFSTNEWADVICSYNENDSNRLTIYVNGTWIDSNTGAACDFPIEQNEMVIDSYPVVGVLPRDTGIFDEVFYRRNWTTEEEAQCLWSMNNFNCWEPPLPPENGNFSITTATECNKQYPCGFSVFVANAPTPPSEPIVIWLLEDGTPVQQIYRDEYTVQDVTSHIRYSVNFAGNGTVYGQFVPGSLLQIDKNYTLEATWGENHATTSFIIVNFRQPDLLGDALLTATYVAPWIIFVCIVAFLLLLLYYFFSGRRR